MRDGRRRRRRAGCHPVAHLTLRDLDWLEAQLAALERGGRAAGDDRARRWSTAGRCRTPTTTASGRRSSSTASRRCSTSPTSRGVFDDALVHRPADEFVPRARLGVPVVAAGARRHRPDRATACSSATPICASASSSSSAVWVPLFLMMLDGGWDFTSRLNGRPLAELSLRPSEYFRRQVRVVVVLLRAARPASRARRGDLFMAAATTRTRRAPPTRWPTIAAAGCDPTTTRRCSGTTSSFCWLRVRRRRRWPPHRIWNPGGSAP